MAIRVFLNKWAESPNGSNIQIKDPIDEYLNSVSLSAPVVSLNHYAKMSLSNRPDRAYNIKVMRGDLTAAEWATLGGLAGVIAVPPGRFDDAISTIKTPVKTKIYSALDGLGIPRSAFDSAATIGGFIRNMLTELGGQQSGFGQWELLPAEWA